MIESLTIGICTGLLYGLFFFKQKRRALVYGQQQAPIMHIVFYSIVRFALIAILFRLVLLFACINPILILISFLGSFWISIFMSKA